MGPEQSVRDIAIEHPSTVPVFESLGIDYCCGGGQSLKQACEHANLPVEGLLELLEGAVPGGPGQDEVCWKDAALTSLTAHIVERHHAYVRDEAPRLEALSSKVADKHGVTHLELVRIRDLFARLSRELLAHMQREERVLFPFICQMESASLAGELAPPAFFGSVRNPVARMLADHDDAGELLARIRELAGGFQAPADACPSYRALYAGLQEFERDLHRHVHLENNLLFPRAIEMERRLESRR